MYLKGVSFGLMSGVITVLGLMMGLVVSTHSKTVVLSGIIVIAISDALSDSFGMHLSVESEQKYTTREIWVITLTTLFTKFFAGITFVVPIIFFSLMTGVIINIIWGFLIIILFSIYLAKKDNSSYYTIVLEHLAIAIFVLAVSYLVGYLIQLFIGVY